MCRDIHDTGYVLSVRVDSRCVYYQCSRCKKNIVESGALITKNSFRPTLPARSCRSNPSPSPESMSTTMSIYNPNAVSSLCQPLLHTTRYKQKIQTHTPPSSSLSSSLSFPARAPISAPQSCSLLTLPPQQPTHQASRDRQNL